MIGGKVSSVLSSPSIPPFHACRISLATTKKVSLSARGGRRNDEAPLSDNAQTEDNWDLRGTERTRDINTYPRT